jgi:hypothetical protein
MECKFVVGQKVICIKKGAWWKYHNLEISKAPVKYNDIVEILRIERDKEGVWLLLKEGGIYRYAAMHFKPLTLSSSRSKTKREKIDA